AGLIRILLTVVGPFRLPPHDGPRHAVMSYLVGATVALGFALGSLGYVMIFHRFNAGWITTVRRYFETTASLVPVCALLYLPLLLFGGRVYLWMDPEHTAGDVLAEHKRPYLNTIFWT